ncbi:MAG: hypothetical protein B7Y41_02950 [Hydrogenophilales bacterium 28-61-23]|nr:MAG: hypothetical protein B7Y41_02950 [Hydrogenophilales bacterium 28-61-23]
MKTLAKQLKQALNALAYADIGERVGRREKHAALHPAVAQPATPPDSPSSNWIALGVGDSLPAPVMAYVIGACERMQANLLLIGDDAMRVRALLAEHLPNLRGIDCKTEEVANASTASVLRAMNLYRGLLFAVSGGEDDPLRPFLRARRAPRTPVPIVLVSEKTPGSPHLPTAHFAFAE